MAKAKGADNEDGGEARSDPVYVRGLDAFAIPEAATTIEAAVYKLRAAIMQGELRPGQKLVEADLCRALDISRASLREALRMLQTERLVELVHNRGPSVARLGKDEIEAIYEVWAMLTGEAVAHFAANARPRDVAAIRKALAALKDNIVRKLPLGQLAATNSFFMTVMKKCGNPVLTEVVISLVSRVNFLRAQALLHEGWGERYAEEIEAIVDAVATGDTDAARAATRHHIRSACTAAKNVAARVEKASSRAAEPSRRTREPRRRALAAA